jgi:hypothetical protein
MQRLLLHIELNQQVFLLFFPFMFSPVTQPGRHEDNLAFCCAGGLFWIPVAFKIVQFWVVQQQHPRKSLGLCLNTARLRNEILVYCQVTVRLILIDQLHIQVYNRRLYTYMVTCPTIVVELPAQTFTSVVNTVIQLLTLELEI